MDINFHLYKINMKKIITTFILSTIALMTFAQVPEGKKVISSLYIYDMASGKSNLILREIRHFEAPN